MSSRSRSMPLKASSERAAMPGRRLDLFWAKVLLPHPETGCMEWTKAKNDAGYGVFAGGPRKLGTVLAHRWIYCQMNGEIPDGHTVDHECVNPGCVRPGHLRALTNEDNVRDGASRRFAYLKQGVCKRGHPLGKKHSVYGCLPCRKQRESEREEVVR